MVAHWPREFKIDSAPPACPRCGPGDTAEVQVGLIGRTTSIAGATTKVPLIANVPGPGRYYCNSCRQYFD